MPTTPLLGIQQVSPNQSQKEVTINDAILQLESATNGTMTLLYGTDTVKALSVAAFTGFFIFRCEDAAADVDLLIPDQVNGAATNRLFAVHNQTGHGLTVKMAAGTGLFVAIPAGEARLLMVSEGDVFIAAQPGVAVSILALTDTPKTYAGKAKQALVVADSEDGLVFVATVNQISGLTDVDLTGLANGHVLAWNGQKWAARTLPTQVTSFLKLSDAPTSFDGQANKFVRVNGAANGLEFVAINQVPTGGNAGQVLTRTGANAYAWAEPTGGDGGSDTGGGVPEAPVDGKQYARKNAAWAEVLSSGGGDGGGGGSPGTQYPTWGSAPGTLTYTFDGGKVPDNFVWNNPSLPGTIITDADATAGTTKALRFREDNLGNNANEYFEVPFEGSTEYRTLTIRYKNQGETRYDGLSVVIDGVELFADRNHSEQYVEASVQLPIKAGILRLRYNSDASNTSGFQGTHISKLVIPAMVTSSAYQRGDTIADYNGASWYCEVADTTDEPGTSAHWSRFAPREETTGDVFPTDTGPSGPLASGNGASDAWRVVARAFAGEAYFSPSNVEFRDTPDVVRRATGGAAIVSAVYENYIPANAFDGDDNTTAIVSGGVGGWIGYDFAAPFVCKQIVLRNRHDNYRQQMPSAFDVQYRNDAGTWVTAWSEVGVVWPNTIIQQTFTKPEDPAVAAQYYPTKTRALNDVDGTIDPADGQTLVWSAAKGKYVPATPVGGGSGGGGTPMEFASAAFQYANGTVTIQNSKNIKSIVRTRTGGFVVTFTTPAADRLKIMPVGQAWFDPFANNDSQSMTVSRHSADLSGAGITEQAMSLQFGPGTNDPKYFRLVVMNLGSTGGGSGGGGSGDSSGGVAPYIIPAFTAYAPEQSETLLDHVFVKSVTFPGNFAESLGNVGTAPAIAYPIDIQKNGASIGTVTINTDKTAAFTTNNAAITFAVGDVLSLICPAAVDLSIARIRLSLLGQRN
jgi:hypothetical protein